MTSEPMLFPLPLAPYESYMMAEDRPAYPVNSLARFRFSGRFDRTALETAMATAVSRHPLLSAVVRRSGRRDVWVASDRAPTLLWLDTPPADSLPPLAPLDVRVEPGLRVIVCQGEGKTDITVQIHHACCDGMGILCFAEDLCIAYAQACGAASKSTLRRLCPEQLRGRGKFGLTTGKLLRMLPARTVCLKGIRWFLMRTPEPLVPHRSAPDDGPTPPGYPTFVTRQLDRAEWEGFSETARRLHVTTNDLLIRDCFLALRDWRRRVVDSPRGWLRLSVPVNLRTIADRRLPAANVMSLVFPDRRVRDMEDPQRLLDSIHEEMSVIKQLRLGLTFVMALQICQWLPGVLRRMARASRCGTTALLTNMGEVADRFHLPYDAQGRLVVGDAVLDSVDGLSPVRPQTCIGLAALAYAGRFHVTLSYDSRVLTAADACGLIDTLIARLRASAETAVTSDPRA